MVSKRRQSPRVLRKNAKAPGSGHPPTEESAKGSAKEKARLQTRLGMDSDELFADLRQGARNVAGVTWQVQVCTYILAASRASALPFVSLTPEGFEDADCIEDDGGRTFLQMKELDAGNGKMAPADLGDALGHAEVSARGARIVIATDGTLGSDLEFTGWDAVLETQSGDGIARVISRLEKLGFTNSQARGILARARVVQLPYRLRERSESQVIAAFGSHPTVASLVVGVLAERLTTIAADQRRRTLANVESIRVSELDAIVTRVQESVDLSGLDGAVREGVCAPVSFASRDETPAEVFYLGVDGLPGHIAARLDMPRPVEMEACAEGLEREANVLIVGPSGSGKSVLLWRAARDLVPGARILRILRVRDDSDARLLDRYVRLLQPSPTSPVLVVADDLGRPQTAAWQQAASLLKASPSVFLLGAARAEDYSPALLVGPTRVVEPKLDPDLAARISERVIQEGFVTAMSSHEAFALADGLLMEFLALLTTGRRLRQVLARQVAELALPDRATQREAARLIAAAHTLGLSLGASRLGRLLAADSSVKATALVGDALAVLRNEHIAVMEDASWRGLHELRSTVITELLHESPPPELGATLSRVALAIDCEQAGWMLRRVAETYPSCLSSVVASLCETFNREEGLGASDLASLFEGAERADNALYAVQVLPELEGARPQGVALEHFALFAYHHRNHGGIQRMGLEAFDRMVDRLEAVGLSIPSREDRDTTLAMVASQVGPSRLRDSLEDADVLTIIRLLEAGGTRLTVSREFLEGVAGRLPEPRDVWEATVWSRLIAASALHLAPTELADVFGDVLVRATRVSAVDECILSVTVDKSEHAVDVSRLLPIDVDKEDIPAMPWDPPRPEGTDVLNDVTVAHLARLKDACPELLRFRIRTVLASGEPYVVRGHEPGYKDMLRERFPERRLVRRSIGSLAAIRRATSSKTWTDVLEAQVASDLLAAATALPLRLKKPDNARRRSEWERLLQDARRRLGGIHPPPMRAGPATAGPQADLDNEDRNQDVVSSALGRALDALDGACPESGLDPNLLGLAMSLQSAGDALEHARDSNRAVPHGLGDVLPLQLVDALRANAGLASALHRQRGLAAKIDGLHPLASVDEIVSEVVGRESSWGFSCIRERLIGVNGALVFAVADPKPPFWTVGTLGWVVLATLTACDLVTTELNSITYEDRQRLGRVVVLGVLGEFPEGALDIGVLADPPVFAGFGFQLSSDQELPPLVLPPDDAQAWALAAGLQESNRSGKASSALRALVARSHQAARSRLRQLEGPPSQEDVRSGDGLGPTSSDPEVSLDAEYSLVLRELEEQVVAEERGTANVFLAEVVHRPVTGAPIDGVAMDLLSKLAFLSLLG